MNPGPGRDPSEFLDLARDHHLKLLIRCILRPDSESLTIVPNTAGDPSDHGSVREGVPDQSQDDGGPDIIKVHTRSILVLEFHHPHSTVVVLCILPTRADALLEEMVIRTDFDLCRGEEGLEHTTDKKEEDKKS